MKTSNNSLADNEVAKNDTPDALISDNDLLKFFNLERENVQDFSITHRKDGTLPMPPAIFWKNVVFHAGLHHATLSLAKPGLVTLYKLSAIVVSWY